MKELLRIDINIKHVIRQDFEQIKHYGKLIKDLEP